MAPPQLESQAFAVLAPAVAELTLAVKSSKVISDGGRSYRAGEAAGKDPGPGLLQTGLSGRAPCSDSVF